MTFDLDAARAAGYRDPEIADFLATQHDFDLQGALKSGYQAPEVVDYLAALPPKKGILERVKDAYSGSGSPAPTEDQIAQGAMGVAVPAEGAVPEPTEPTDARRVVGAGESAARAAGNSFAAIPEAFYKYLVGPAAVSIDKLASMVGGDPTARQDAVFRVVDDFANLRKSFYDIDPKQEVQGFSGKVGAVVGQLPRDLALAIITAGEAPAVEFATQVPTAAQAIVQAMGHGAKSMTVPGLLNAADRYQSDIDAGVDPATAAKQAALAGLSTVAGGAGPMAIASTAESAAARFAQRAVSSVPLTAAQGEVTRVLSNKVYGEAYPEHQREFNLEDAVAGVVPMTALTGALGPRMQQVRTRDELGYRGAPAAEHTASSVPLDGLSLDEQVHALTTAPVTELVVPTARPEAIRMADEAVAPLEESARAEEAAPATEATPEPFDFKTTFPKPVEGSSIAPEAAAGAHADVEATLKAALAENAPEAYGHVLDAYADHFGDAAAHQLDRKVRTEVGDATAPSMDAEPGRADRGSGDAATDRGIQAPEVSRPAALQPAPEVRTEIAKEVGSVEPPGIEPQFEDFTRRSDGEVKVFPTEATAQLYQSQRSNRVPGNMVPRETPEGWRLSRPAADLSKAPEAAVAPAPEAQPKVAEVPQAAAPSAVPAERPAAEIMKASPSDRRGGGVVPGRQRVDEMTPDQMRRALLTDDLTGLGNRRAYDEAPKRAVQAHLDADGLKWVNDNLGHGAGDDILKAIGTAVREEGVEGYHVSGDEFVAQFDDHGAGHEALARVRDRLANAEVTAIAPDGTKVTKKGIGFSYGLGTDHSSAESGLQRDKLAREQSGERAGRGAEPAGVAREAPVQAEAPRSETAAKEPERAVTPAPAHAENSAKAETQTTAAPRGDEAKLSRSDKAPPQEGRAGPDAERVTKRLGLNAKVVEAEEHLPQHVRDQIEREGAAGEVRGAYDPTTGEIYLVRSNLHSEGEAIFVALHESAHRGLVKLFGSDLRPVLGKLYLSNERLRARANEMMRERGYDQARATEEAIADMALRGQAHNLSGWERFTQFVRDWLVNRGIKFKFSDDALEFIAGAAARAGKEPMLLTSLPDQLKAPDAALSRAEKATDDTVRITRRTLPEWAKKESAPVKEALEKAGLGLESTTLAERAKNLFQTFKRDFRQGVADQLAPLAKLNYRAYMMARLSKGSDGGLEALMMYGKPKLTDGALDVDYGKGGFIKEMQKLQGEHDRFFAWVAGNRAAQLKGEGRENLFTDQDISALKDLNQGKLPDGASRTAAYGEALRSLNEYGKSVLDIAQQSGIIDGASRHIWEKEFYVPFYRNMADGATGPSIKSGLVNQNAFKKLKGGATELNDLMANTLRNWSHLLSASMKNKASAASLDAAVDAGIADKLPAQEKGAVFVLKDGREEWYRVNDPMVLNAITALEFNGFKGKIMDWLSKPKFWLTFGVTKNPAFMIRNTLRDTISAMAVTPVSYNAFKNLADGWAGTKHDSEARAKLMAGGGMVRFGTMLEGNRAEQVKRLIDGGVNPESILDNPHKVNLWLKHLWDVYSELGDRSENINRAAIYKNMREQGKDHLEASFEARDLLDFSKQGSWAAVRFLTQVVPFMNARIQGLDKDVRGFQQDKGRFGIVMGATTMATLALWAAYRNDEEWSKREEWDRDNFWAFRIGDVMYRLPKPFEIGAMATMAERLAEWITSTEPEAGKRFAKRIGSIIGDNLSMNPVPQAVKPWLELYANKESFTGKQIESEGMQKLEPSERIGPSTTLPAQLLAKLDPTESVSPVQIDSLVRSYFGWVGSSSMVAVDRVLGALGARDAALPSARLKDITQNFAESLPSDQSRYLTTFYDQAKEIDQAYNTWSEHLRLGQGDKADSDLAKNEKKIGDAPGFDSIKKVLGELHLQERQILLDTSTTAKEKRAALQEIAASKNELAKDAVLGR